MAIPFYASLPDSQLAPKSANPKVLVNCRRLYSSCFKRTMDRKDSAQNEECAWLNIEEVGNDEGGVEMMGERMCEL